MANILVLGGGFAGIEAAIYLRKNGHSVTLVSDRDYFYIYPTSIWIPTGEVNRSDVSIPLKDLALKHGFDLIIDEVAKVEAKIKKITLSSGLILENYENIIIALGQGKLKPKGAENTLSICGKPEEADEIYNRLQTLIAKGGGKLAFGFGGNPQDTSAVRGGPAFEVLFNVHNYLKKLGLRDKFEITFFAPMAKPGEKMGEKALVMMDRMFKSCNIDKKVGSKIVSFESDGIIFEDSTKLESDLTMFIVAGSGHDILVASDLPRCDTGFVVTNEFNEVDGMDGVWAIGDSAKLLGDNDWKTKQGHIAEVMAKNVAHNISNPENKKSYIEHLNILCMMDIGNGAAFVYRSNTAAKMIPLPIIGHWMKLGWGWYCKQSKLGNIPRIHGM